MARQHGLFVTGTLGILAACVRQGHLLEHEANDLLRQVIALDFHSPVSSLDALLKQE